MNRPDAMVFGGIKGISFRSNTGNYYQDV